MVGDLKHLLCEQRLRDLELFGLERTEGDLISTVLSHNMLQVLVLIEATVVIHPSSLLLTPCVS